MAREKVLTTVAGDDEASKKVDAALRPKLLKEVIGQRKVAERLEIASLESLDESAHAILGYLLGGSGKT